MLLAESLQRAVVKSCSRVVHCPAPGPGLATRFVARRKVFTFVSTNSKSNWSETIAPGSVQAFHRVLSQVAP